TYRWLADRRSAGGCMAAEGQSRRTQSGPVVDILRSTPKSSCAWPRHPRDHLADDFRHQGIRQDYRKARRVRQLPAMRFDESDAVEQQRFGAPTHQRNATCGDDVQCVRIGARRRTASSLPCRAEWTFWALNCTELPSESRVTSTASPALAAYAP